MDGNAGNGRVIPAWRRQFDIGHRMLDAQHRMMHAQLRRIEQAWRDEIDLAHIVGLCTELRLLTRFHFACEENLMRLAGYPDFDRHARAHLALLAELDEWIADVGRGFEAPQKLMHVVAAWLVEHIGERDMPMARFLADAGALRREPVDGLELAPAQDVA